jgi:hypothetical protein
MRSMSFAREGDVVSARTTPEDGDIVIVRQAQRDGPVVYVLHTAPGPDAEELATAEEAAAHAFALVDRYGVRAWLTTDDSYDFVPL